MKVGKAMCKEECAKLLKKFRRDLHKIPELSLVEYETSKYIKNVLDEHNIKYEEVLDTGIIVHLKGTLNKTIAFRTDMDALPTEEKNEIDFKSNNKSNMHSCGHDGHMANLLVFAIYLSKKTIKTSVVLIFQPAEEKFGGGNLIIKTGALEKYDIEAFYGMHLAPDIKIGTIASKPNEMMAMSGEFEVVVKGKSAHAGMANLGNDAIIVASNLVMQYQTILSRMVSPLDKKVINIGKIIGGTSSNIVCDKVTLLGTIRTFSKQTFKDILKFIENINMGLEKAYGTEIIFKMVAEPYLPVINDTNLYKNLIPLITKDIQFQEIVNPYMLSEDFSFYQQYRKGIFFFLGTKTETKDKPLHHCNFNFDEIALYESFKLFKNIRECYDNEKI
jgi:amidohydrolase